MQASEAAYQLQSACVHVCVRVCLRGARAHARTEKLGSGRAAAAAADSPDLFICKLNVG